MERCVCTKCKGEKLLSRRSLEYHLDVYGRMSERNENASHSNLSNAAEIQAESNVLIQGAFIVCYVISKCYIMSKGFVFERLYTNQPFF